MPIPSPPVKAPPIADVYLACPSYDGTAHVASTLASVINVAVDGSVHLVARSDNSSSILTDCFNRMLAEALTLRDRGLVTHFAMLHADVVPEPECVAPGVVSVGWLDVLWREMRTSGADVISAVVPIRDRETSNPRVSTAIGRWDSGSWTCKALRLADRARLPLTFTAADVRERPDDRLLVNTGCMLMDLRNEALWDGFAFSFRDRIVRNGDSYEALIIGEDYGMSIDVAERGGTVAATWAVPVKHYGLSHWSSDASPEPGFAEQMGASPEPALPG